MQKKQKNKKTKYLKFNNSIIFDIKRFDVPVTIYESYKNLNKFIHVFSIELRQFNPD